MIKVGRRGSNPLTSSTTGLVKKSGSWRMATTSRCISAGRKRTRLRVKSGRECVERTRTAYVVVSSTTAWAARSSCSKRGKTSCTR
jgi:hypothetical protein